MKRLLAAAALGIALVASACASSHARVSSSRTVSESAVIEDGTVRCTATVLTTPVEAGYALGTARVGFTLHNLTKRKVQLVAGWQEGSAVVSSPDGTTYDPLWEIEHSPGGIVG